LIDLDEAQSVAHVLNRLPLHYFDHLDAHSTAATDDLPERFSEWRAQLPPNLPIEVSPELAGLLDEPLRARITASAFPDESSGVDWFGVTVDLKPEDVTLSDEEFRLLIAANGRWVRLPQRGWQRLEIDSNLDPTLT